MLTHDHHGVRCRNSRAARTAISVVVLALLLSTVPAQQDTRSLSELSLEELMDVEIMSAAKKEQKVSDAMGAVYVITNEEIRRSGMTSIPEVLRMVPGLQVARITGSTYAITARGFASQFSNKLLVLIDGRTVYSPLYSGVYWDAKDVMLEDVQRIEVVRGPGGALWGANAVNGVINIITKPTGETQGGVVYGAGGNEERVMFGGRYGFEIDEKTTGRVYAKFFDRDGQVDPAGVDQPDDWWQARAGFRFDHVDDQRTSTLQGDYYQGDTDTVNNLPSAAPPYMVRRTLHGDVEGGNLLARWRNRSSGADTMVQLYYDFVRRDDGFLRQRRHTVDLESQWRYRLHDDLEVMAGLGIRGIRDTMYGSSFVRVKQERESDLLFNGFLRAEYDLIEDTLTLAFGAKLEHNEYTGFETQPDFRLRWHPNDDHTVWGAYSRAVRVPGRAEGDVDTIVSSVPGFGGLALQTELIGNRDFEPEEIAATELGYRLQATESLSFDASAFYNEYDNLLAPRIAGSPTLDPTVPRLVLPIAFGNTVHGETYGIEVAAQWRPMDTLALSGGYSYLRVQLHTEDPTLLPGYDSHERSHPHNQAHLRVNFNLTEELEFDTSLFYVDRLSHQTIPSYVRWDARVGWSPTKNTDASLVFQNILDGQHAEFGTVFYQQPTETERSVYLKVTTRF